MYMTKVERMIFDEGFDSGIQQGLQQGIQQANALSALNLALLADQRYAELEVASKDNSYREKLFKEYGITY